MAHHLFPNKILARYSRAVQNSQQHIIESLVKNKTAPCTTDNDNEALSEEEALYWEHSCHISANNPHLANNMIDDSVVDIGMNYDWSQRFLKERGQMT